MSSRDAILGRIRTALAEQGAAGGLPAGARPFGGAFACPTDGRPPVPEVWPRENRTIEQMTERFAQELEAIGGEVRCCGSMPDARAKLAQLLEEAGWNSIGGMDRPLCRELCWELDPNRITWASPDWGPKDMAQLPAGVVEADYLLADTGTCMIACAHGQDRLMCYLPPVSLVVAKTDRLVEHMPAAWAQIAQRAADPQLRGEFVFVTGPSRTADIEKILILGVHGPKRLIVLLVGCQPAAKKLSQEPLNMSP